MHCLSCANEDEQTHQENPNTSEQPYCSDRVWVECYFRSTKHERLRDLAAGDNLKGTISSGKKTRTACWSSVKLLRGKLLRSQHVLQLFIVHEWTSVQ